MQNITNADGQCLLINMLKGEKIKVIHQRLKDEQIMMVVHLDDSILLNV